jgi:hypothetical protein
MNVHFSWSGRGDIEKNTSRLQIRKELRLSDLSAHNTFARAALRMTLKYDFACYSVHIKLREYPGESLDTGLKSSRQITRERQIVQEQNTFIQKR